MQTLTFSKDALQRDLRPHLMESESLSPITPLHSYQHVDDLEGARIASWKIWH
jgi:hypothetical protein